MKKAFIINAHLKYLFSAGRLNTSLTERAAAHFNARGYEVVTTTAEDGYDVATEVEKFKSANVVLLQMPLNWMGVPWSFKKYIDDVWTAGMTGALSAGDGRSQAAPKENYGMGGKLSGRYMLSVTANVPKEAFNDPGQKFFAGRSEDDLLLPMHLNFKWIGLEKVPTFLAYDVMKNPEINRDFARFDAHMATHF